MSEPERILIIRPSALGDVCRSVPVAASLRRRFPAARITWLVQAGFQDAIREHPAVDEVLLFDRRGMARPWRPKAAGRLRRFLADLRRGRFDLVVDAQGLGRSGLFTLATGARTRVGFAEAREGAPLAYSRRVRSPRDRHAVDRMLDLVESLGAPRVEEPDLVVPSEAAAWWASASGWLGDRAYVVFAPTARWRCKQWPAERFADLARWGLASGRHVVFVGAPGEEAAVAAAAPTGVARLDPAAIEAGASTAGTSPVVLDLAGRTTVGGMMAVIGRAAGVVACDSAALHMAAGLGVPSVALFGPTDPRLVGPRGDRSTVLRRVEPGEDPIRYRRLRDDDRYMRRLDAAEVQAALAARLGEGEATG